MIASPNIFTAMLFTLLLACQPVTANSIQIINGDFEDVSGMSVTTPEVFTGIPNGWEFSRLPGGTSDTVQVLDYGFVGSPVNGEGDYYLEGHQEFAAGTLFQTLSGFSIGETYQLFFLWGNRGLTGKDEYEFAVRIADIEFARSGVGPVELRPVSLDFIATSETHQLAIDFFDPGAGESDTMGAFDHFSIVLIPEPCSLLLCACIGWTVLGKRQTL